MTTGIEQAVSDARDSRRPYGGEIRYSLPLDEVFSADLFALVMNEEGVLAEDVERNPGSYGKSPAEAKRLPELLKDSVTVLEYTVDEKPSEEGIQERINFMCVDLMRAAFLEGVPVEHLWN